MIKKQTGWTMWSGLAVIVLLATLALLFMRLFPPYMDNLKTQEALDTLADNARVTSMSRREIIGELDNILYIDFAHEVTDLKESLTIEKTKKDMIILVDYEVVVPLVHNISALMEFQNQVDVPIR
ncbi:MAG: DUF4845 domain-containing protein [Gammaproteobacteria bacterium]|nr:DUF4845 domain-containing protein [Gammaproteobacteria bacterium]